MRRCALGQGLWPWLSTAGAGDVLAGYIAGLMAQDVLPYEAAQTAVFLHAQCALHFGAGLIASDLATALPQVLRALEAGQKIS
jgi:NAD(P)H-hydrate repair Nnr-like enzyme with NAD(P)H-hydrate dehydratase domain